MRMKKVYKIFAGTLLCVVILYLGVLAALWAAQETIMFKGRTMDVAQTPASMQWPFEEIWADVPGGRTHGWWIPLDQARGVVLFSHGSGKNISYYLDDAAIFRDLGFSVLLYDYGGYGQSTGKPSEARCYTDIRAMWKELTEVHGISPERIVLAGCSMGGGVNTDLAATVKAGAVILESTITSIPDAFSETIFPIPAWVLTRLQFRNIDKAPRIQSPTLVVHSVDDTVVPFAEGRRLYDALTVPKAFVEIHGSHGGGKFSSGAEYTSGLKKFLDNYIK